jgi:hypothetical protein
MRLSNHERWSNSSDVAWGGAVEEGEAAIAIPQHRDK